KSISQAHDDDQAKEAQCRPWEGGNIFCLHEFSLHQRGHTATLEQLTIYRGLICRAKTSRVSPRVELLTSYRWSLRRLQAQACRQPRGNARRPGCAAAWRLNRAPSIRRRLKKSMRLAHAGS